MSTAKIVAIIKRGQAAGLDVRVQTPNLQLTSIVSAEDEGGGFVRLELGVPGIVWYFPEAEISLIQTVKWDEGNEPSGRARR